MLPVRVPAGHRLSLMTVKSRTSLRANTVSWRVNAERMVLLGWSRAVLLQLAHPLVAAGVHEHSTFRAGPVTAARRLHHTVGSMLALTFGDAAARDRAISHIRQIHRRVHGELPDTVGCFARGTPYSAEDPDLLLWVHATLLESLPLVYERLIAPLSEPERDAYCREAVPVAVALGARADEVPADWRSLTRYMASMHASGILTVGAAAMELRTAVLSPSFGPFIPPVPWMNRLITVGLLPQEIRQQYGCTWTDGDAQRCDRLTGSLRTLRRFLPRPVSLWRESRRSVAG